MESLALIVSLMLLAVYGSGFIAFGLSWFKSPVTRVITYILATFSLLSGVWMAIQLTDLQTAFLVGFLPVTMGIFSIFNAMRTRKV